MMDINLELIARPYVDKVKRWKFNEIVLEYLGC